MKALFSSQHNYLDRGSGAAITTRDELLELVRRGHEVQTLCGAFFDGCDCGEIELYDILRSRGIPFSEKVFSAVSDDGDIYFKLVRFNDSGIDSSVFLPLERYDFNSLKGLWTRECERVFLAYLEETLESFSPDVFVAYGGQRIVSEKDDSTTLDVVEGHDMRYDTIDGSSSYVEIGSVNNRFNLVSYIAHNVRTVNCYDQAGAVVVLGTLLGVRVNYAFMDRFGYINQVDLVGVGLCNNPFYENPRASSPLKIVDENQDRTSFANHAFGVYNGCVYDACAGPTLGITLPDYISDVIDVSTDWERRHAGSISDVVFVQVILR